MHHSSKRSVFALDTPEEIERWREARRKNWPSEANTKRKLAERERQVQRGELLPQESDSKRSRRQGGPSWQFNAGSSAVRGPDKSKPNGRAKEEDKANEPIPESQQSLASLLAYSSDSGADEDDAPEELKSTARPTPATAAPDDSNTAQALGNSGAGPEPSRKRPCKFFERGHCTKGKWCKFLHEPKGKKDRRSGTTHPGKDGYQFHGTVVRRGPGLLDRLLSAESNLETSRLLQCLRYLVASGQAA